MTDMTTEGTFYEDDEPLQDVLTAFADAEKALTAPHLPPGATFVTPPRTYGSRTVELGSPVVLGMRVLTGSAV